MTIQATTAAQAMQNQQGEISSHQLISLLMAGGLERIHQAKESLADGNKEDATVLVQKVVGIINGLRNSLNFEQGGEIAVNLDKLYDYMISRIDDNADDKLEVMSEVGELLDEVKGGWDGMDVKVPEFEGK